jgi:hypothetical protein
MPLSRLRDQPADSALMPMSVLACNHVRGSSLSIIRPPARKDPMASLREDIDASAAWIAQALQSSGYHADFSTQSLWSIDRFFDDNSDRGQSRRGGPLGTDLGSRIFALGAYVGEVVRRNAGGAWHSNDQDPQGEINVELVLADGTKIWPVQRVMKRYKNGAEDGIAAYGAALGLNVGQPPQPPKKRFFGRGS